MDKVQVLVRSRSDFAGGVDGIDLPGHRDAGKDRLWLSPALYGAERTGRKRRGLGDAAGDAAASGRCHHRVKDGGYGLLLDPQRQTVTQIAGGDGGALTLHVDTKEVSWHLPRKGDGHITLTYTLLLGTQALSALHLALTLTKEEKDA